jgi:Flp pilus assembly pilin Flp
MVTQSLMLSAILFSIGFAAWAFAQFRSSGGATSLVMAILFAVIAVALIVYLKNLKRFLRR